MSVQVNPYSRKTPTKKASVQDKPVSERQVLIRNHDGEVDKIVHIRSGDDSDSVEIVYAENKKPFSTEGY